MLSDKWLHRIDEFEYWVRRKIGWPSDENRITGWIYARRKKRNDGKRISKSDKTSGSED